MEHFIWLQTSISVVTYFLRMRGKTFPIKNLFAIVTYLLVNLMSSLRTFYGRHHDLVDRYGISVSQIKLPCSFNNIDCNYL
jgi:hypothetical protein